MRKIRKMWVSLLGKLRLGHLIWMHAMMAATSNIHALAIANLHSTQTKIWVVTINVVMYASATSKELTSLNRVRLATAAWSISLIWRARSCLLTVILSWNTNQLSQDGALSTLTSLQPSRKYALSPSRKHALQWKPYSSSTQPQSQRHFAKLSAAADDYYYINP